MRYTSKENIKAIKEYIKTALPERNRRIIKDMKNKYGWDIFSKGNVYKNVQEFRQVLVTRIKDEAPEIWKEIEKYNHLGPTRHEQEIIGLIDKFINEKYAEEYSVIWTNFDEINDKINGPNGFTKKFNIEPLYIHQVVEAENIDEIIDKLYDKKHVPKAEIEKTQRVMKNIDDFFQGYNYDTFYMAMKHYLNNKDENELHNILNKPM